MIRLLQLLRLAHNRCLSCDKPFLGRVQGLVCEECISSLKPYHPMDYDKRVEYVSSYRVFGLYQATLRSIILGIKFHHSKSLAQRLGLAIKDHLWEFIKEMEPDLITFPPLNIRRLWTRGFNHVEEVLKGAGVPYIGVFKRVGFSPPMARLSKEKRQKAVMEYTIREDMLDFLEDKRVLLVDDILTTGATLSRLAYLLLSVGAKEVYAYIIAKD